MLAHDKMKDNCVDFMLSSVLHCTAQVHEGRDFYFEKEWFMDIPESEELYLYCCDKFCACSVKLSDTQLHVFFIPESVAHVSLAKIKKPTSNMYSLTLGVYKKFFQEMCKGNREVMCHDKGMFLNLGTSPTLLEIHPQLKKVPLGLWAQGKHDVGLIRPPVVITPKSDFRPRQSQYPLKSEAIEGIRPVFNSLLKAGVIVPWSDSPLRTPIFPVREAKNPPQPDEWRFVEDLQAVNAAVKQRAPDVPNSYTILSQVPANSEWFSVVDLANAFFRITLDRDSLGLHLYLTDVLTPSLTCVRGIVGHKRYTTHC
ncbi:uncharacterized protein LOC128610579 [Ictalurus furcatus]|uniref:uncharacterized protein LOC128610579 n=1 Tax=Ictalurus furcatus TaxID=66913 RepID=UPI0023503D11|nr:uncharacterized protein LOC128610579 [Ictalurus furcatus]